MIGRGEVEGTIDSLLAAGRCSSKIRIGIFVKIGYPFAIQQNKYAKVKKGFYPLCKTKTSN